MTVTGDLEAIPVLAGAALRRVLQEGLTNAIKHAPGAAVVVNLYAGSEQSSLAIRNDPPESTSLLLRDAGGAHGLRGLAERVTELGGSLHGEPTSSGGWVLSAVIPASREAGDSELQPAVRRSRGTVEWL